MLDFVKNICRQVGNFFGFNNPTLYGGIVLLAGALLVLVLIIAIIASACKKKKANKKAVKEQPSKLEEKQ